MHTWERASYEEGVSSRCTIKFVGEIPPWPGATAFGVEWDHPGRGRNSGEMHGVKYFSCRVAGAGSFIKASRQRETPQTFGSAIHAKYIENPGFDEIQLSEAKAIETVGIEKIHRRQERVTEQESLSVEGSLVNSLRSDEIPLTLFGNLKRLDLSNNLFADFKSLLSNLVLIPKLESLRLNGNRFYFANDIEEGEPYVVCNNLESLELTSTLVTPAEIAVVSRSFPNLLTLGLAENRLQAIPPDLPSRLEVLDVSVNLIPTIGKIPGTLKQILLYDNPITAIADDDELPPVVDLRGISLNWESISALGAKRVSDLHISHGETKAVLNQPFIIGRNPALTKLDGIVITDREREDAELYTLNAVMRKKHPPLPSQRWRELTEKYGVPPPPPNRSIRARLITFYVDKDPNPIRIVHDAPISRLRLLIARLKGVPPRKIQIKCETGDLESESDSRAGLLIVSDVLSDGDRIETYEVLT